MTTLRLLWRAAVDVVAELRAARRATRQQRRILMAVVREIRRQPHCMICGALPPKDVPANAQGFICSEHIGTPPGGWN